MTEIGVFPAPSHLPLPISYFQNISGSWPLSCITGSTSSAQATIFPFTWQHLIASESRSLVLTLSVCSIRIQCDRQSHNARMARWALLHHPVNSLGDICSSAPQTMTKPFSRAHHASCSSSDPSHYFPILQGHFLLSVLYTAMRAWWVLSLQSRMPVLNTVFLIPLLLSVVPFLDELNIQ